MAQATTFSLTIDLPESDSDAAQGLLYDAGAEGLEVRDSEAPPMPGVRGPAKGEAILVAYFPERADADAALEAVRGEFPSARGAVAVVEPRDWSESWKSLIRSVDVGRLWVGPPWMAAQAPAGKTRIVIEPKMAFGTGDHPTTTLCLDAVDAFVAGHAGCSVLDVGTGTGVLAIAARKLGAGHCVGVDNDAMSVELAKENAVSNATPEVELSGKTLDALPPGKFDLVLANILANTLVELAPLIVPRVGTRLILAGVLVHQAQEVSAAFERLGLVPEGTRTINEWIRLDFKAR